MAEEIAVDSVEDTSTTEAEEVTSDQSEAEVEPSKSASDGETPEEAEDGEESETDEDQPDAESQSGTVEVEYDGEKFTVPTKIKDALMRDKDYTQKTQSLAEQRQGYESEVADFQQYMEATKAQSDNMANLAAMDQQLQSFQAYDWNGAFDADITSATKLQHQFQQLQSQRDQLVGTIQQGETQRQADRHENMVKTAKKTDALLSKELPNWSEEKKSEIGKFAVETMGLPAQMVSQAVTPAEIKTLYYAEIGFKVANQVKTSVKAKKSPIVDIKPSSKIAAKRQSAPKSLFNVSDPEEYRKMRLAQKRKG
jgi:hypothetical protein